MAFPTPSNTVQFVQALDGSMKIRITDTTDWVGNGITLSSLEIFIKVTSPDGNVFHPINLSFPDIDPDVSLSVEFDCPNDIQGDPQTGDYKVLEYATSTIGPSTYTTADVTHNLCADYPALCIQDVLDCLYMYATVSDITPWATNNFTVDDREFTLYYPQGSGVSPIVTTSDTITTPDLWANGTYTAVLDVTVTSGNFTGSFRLSKDFKANCMNGADLCQLVCVLNKVQLQTLSSNSTVYADANIRYSKMVDLMTHIMAAAKCGMGPQLDSLLGQFYDLGGATRNCDCGCADGSGPTLLVPIHPGSGGSVVQIIVAEGPGITVSYNPGTSTYTVSMSPANVALLASLYNTVVTSTNGSITVTPATVGITTTYNLAVAHPPKDSLEITWTVDLALGTEALGSAVITGTYFKAPTIIESVGSQAYRVTDFLTTAVNSTFNASVWIEGRTLTSFMNTADRYATILIANVVFGQWQIGAGNQEFSFGLIPFGFALGPDLGSSKVKSWFSGFVEKFSVRIQITKV